MDQTLISRIPQIKEYKDLIEVKESLRELGVIVSDDATFTNHIIHVCQKVKQKAGWIFRTFLTRNTKVMTFPWKSLMVMVMGWEEPFFVCFLAVPKQPKQ